jgi:hypothetical protein
MIDGMRHPAVVLCLAGMTLAALAQQPVALDSMVDRFTLLGVKAERMTYRGRPAVRVVEIAFRVHRDPQRPEAFYLRPTAADYFFSC